MKKILQLVILLSAVQLSARGFAPIFFQYHAVLSLDYLVQQAQGVTVLYGLVVVVGVNVFTEYLSRGFLSFQECLTAFIFFRGGELGCTCQPATSS